MHTATAVPSPTKIELREQALTARRQFAVALPSEARGELELQLLRQVMPYLGSATTIAAYHPMSVEIDPIPILDAVVTGGRIAALPWFADRDAVMIFREAPVVATGPWGVWQPGADAAVVCPEVVLVPLVAADEACNRIGHGKGHYDRALSHLRANGSVRTIGLAWDMQILKVDIPTDPWDVPLDAIATPSRWIESAY